MIRRFLPTITFLLYQLNAVRLRRASPNAIVLHPGPMNRGIEITPEVADGPQSCVLEQVTNGVAVRMTILYLLIGGATESGTHPALEVKRRNRRMLRLKTGG